VVKVSIEVHGGVAHFDVGVQAGSIQWAMSLVMARYPKSTVRVRFPIEGQSFLVEDRRVRTGIVGLELPARVAA
jgi:regulation of enolase protein 1 (concanavalin A-like superfamily)